MCVCPLTLLIPGLKAIPPADELLREGTAYMYVQFSLAR